MEFDGANTRETFDGDKGVRCLHRAVLTSIPGEQEPGTLVSHVSEELQHLLTPDLASLIHHNESAVRELALPEEAGHGLRCREPIAFHLDHLLALRGEDDDGAPGLLDCLNEATEHEALSRAGTSSEKRDQVG
jgi:hypothetical protein